MEGVEIAEECVTVKDDDAVNLPKMHSGLAHKRERENVIGDRVTRRGEVLLCCLHGLILNPAADVRQSPFLSTAFYVCDSVAPSFYDLPMADNGRAQVVPTTPGIAGEVVQPPWWDDPAEQGREMVRLLGVIAADLAEMNARLGHLESLVPQAMRSPLAGLFQLRR